MVTDMDKQKILSLLIVQLSERQATLIRSRDDTRAMARDAPGANQSHSDTSKSQLSNVQLELDRVNTEITLAISRLHQLQPQPSDKIKIGAIFALKRLGDEEQAKRFFMVPAGGGETINVDELTVVSISTTAPLSRLCLGKEEGDEIEWAGKVYEILGVE